MLTKLFTYRPALLIGSLVTWTLAFCLPLATGLINQRIFDELVDSAGGTAATLWWLFAGLAIIAIVDPLLMLAWFWVHTTFENTVEALARTNLMRWIVSRAGRRGRRPSAATMLGHLRDDVQGHTDLVNEWYRLSGEGAFVVIALIIMLRIDVMVTLLTFVPLAAVVLATHRLRARLAPLWGRAREETTRVTNHIGDTFGSVLAVKVAGAEPAMLRRFRELNDRRGAAEVHSIVAEARLDATAGIIVVASRGLVLLVGAAAMLEGRFGVGDFVLFTVYLEWMLMLPRRMGRLLGQQKQAHKARERLSGLLEDTPLTTLVEHRPLHMTGEPPAVAATPEAGPGDRLESLTVTGLDYHHPDGRHALHDIDLRLERGTVTVVTGEIGSGKSTLLEVLLGLRAGATGTIAWNDVPVDDPGEFLVPPRSAYKPQTPRLFGVSVHDNIALGRPGDDVALDRALAATAMTDEVAALSDGTATMVGSRGVTLSGGQRERLGVARMVFRSAQLNVVDDFASGVDHATEAALWTTIEAGRDAGTTYLLTSHRPMALRRADRVVVMRDGRIEATGTLTEVLAASPTARRIWQSDTAEVPS